MSKGGLKVGMIQILAANMLNMLFSIGTNFLLPKYLSVGAYAQIKTYQLYISYVAVLHFGYNDGMYLKYGGKKIDEIGNSDLQRNLSTLRVFQTFVMICSVSAALFVNDIALLVAAIAILPQNIIPYYKNFFQAVGEFKRYSHIMNLTTGLTFFVNIFLLFVAKTDNYVLYIVGYLFLTVVLWISLERMFKEQKAISYFKIDFSFKEVVDNISNGILLLLGNFSSILLTSMDRWFTKFLLGSVAFAQYSFAVSMENFLNVAVTPISVTMFNYFCRHDENKDILYIRELVIGFATIIVSVAFPLKFILEIFLEKYIDSVFVIFTLFTAQIFYIIIKSIYVNLYKARKIQNRYFVKLCFIVIIAFAFNVVCYLLYHRKESFAVGTLLSAVVWFFISQFDFKELQYSIRHYIYLFVEVTTFLFCGNCMKSISGGIIYVVVTLIMLKVCMPEAMIKYLMMINDATKKIRKRIFRKRI